MTSNPLIDKYHEIYGKKEEPKPQKTHTEELKELRDTSTIPIKKLTSYDVDSSRDSFLQIAEKIKKWRSKSIFYEYGKRYNVWNNYYF